MGGEQALYAYDVVTRQPLRRKHFHFPRNQAREEPLGIWSDGLKMWIVNGYGTVRVYAWPFTSTTCPQCPRFPDLIAQLHDAPVSDYTPMAGQAFTLQVVVRNQGSATADATRIRAYRSADPVISRSDEEAGSSLVPSLARNGAGVRTIDVTAPSTAGTRYYGACVDGVSGERNTTNNCSAAVAVAVTGDMSFTDDPIEAGVTAVKAVHFTELRQRIDALRVSHGLAPSLWIDATLKADTTPVAAVHVSELRQALRQAYDAADEAIGFNTERAQSGGSIRAEHVNELRRAVEALESRP